jgi:serine/threonine protein kinase/Flp pilus assembly protein TadD
VIGTPDSAPSAVAPPSGPGDLVAAEMAAAWRRGDCPPVEVYLERHPDLLDSPEGTLRLIFEEVCLRQERGEEVAREELIRRFPRWANELAVMLDCHRLLQNHLALPQIPTTGQSLGDFILIAELGRGRQGQVFLAAQAALADRPVVLKVTPIQDREFLSLARLQHTHVIPLHGVYDFPERNLRALCQPYLGGATLAQLLDWMRSVPAARRTGQSLIATLDEAAAESPLPLPGQRGPREALARASYTEAVCWIGACLADGLHYAHERGLVHLDVKPSNVLLAADGQPLLLDFHLALEPLVPGHAAPEGFGGTPNYMSPEQERACAAAHQGEPVPASVDGRSDIYSLGRLLYVALGGDDGAASSSIPLHRRNPLVSVGLSDVIHKSLAVEPDKRYLTAAALAEDLRRYLAHRPFRGVANRSLRERWRNWRRRRPAAPLWIGLLLALTAVGALFAAALIGRYQDAQGALREGQEQVQRRAYREAMHTLMRGKALAEGVPGGGSLLSTLDQELRLARRAQAAIDLHAVADSLRFLAGAEIHSTHELEVLESHCRTAWAARGSVADRTSATLDAVTEEQVRTDLLDVALLWADLKRRLVQGKRSGEGREEVQAILTEAEALLGPSAVLARERRLLAEAPGSEAPHFPADHQLSSWEFIFLGRSLLRRGKLEQAAEQLQRASDLRPQDFWANFYQGVCAYRRQHYAEAVYSFGEAIAAAPRSPECYFNRGLAYAAWGEKALALRDYNRALELAPGFAAATLNRGVLHFQEQRLPQAQEDFQEALRQGADPATVHYNLALLHVARGDSAMARQHLEQCLHHNPAHPGARSLRDRLGQGR